MPINQTDAITTFVVHERYSWKRYAVKGKIKIFEYNDFLIKLLSYNDYTIIIKNINFYYFNCFIIIIIKVLFIKNIGVYICPIYSNSSIIRSILFIFGM